MQVLEGSIIYRLLKKLFFCYEHSMLKKFVSVFAVSCKNSFIARSFRAVKKRRGFYRYSLVSRVAGYFGKHLSRLYKLVDRLVLQLSGLLQKWADGSLLCILFRFIGTASKERISALLIPAFGAGYIIGRLILNRLMIRDILFLSASLFAAAVLLIDREKLMTYFRNSLFCKLYLFVLG